MSNDTTRAAPADPARQPLTDGEKSLAWARLFGPNADPRHKPYNSYVTRSAFDKVVAAIERAHNITGDIHE